MDTEDLKIPLKL